MDDSDHRGAQSPHEGDPEANATILKPVLWPKFSQTGHIEHSPAGSPEQLPHDNCAERSGEYVDVDAWLRSKVGHCQVYRVHATVDKEGCCGEELGA
eukprot:scaffold192977_cov43-Tisochrysis_lutea.AAC.1